MPEGIRGTTFSAFVAPVHTNHQVLQQSSFAARCTHSRRRSMAPRRSRSMVPTARVRRGFKAEPEIPENLFEAKPVPDIDLQKFDFSTLKGDVVFVSNVASLDDRTDSVYKMMADLIEKYGDSGFHVLGFPCNWFGQKEYTSFPDIKKFVHETYSDKINLFTTTDVEWSQVFALGCKYYPGEIIWNFHGQFLFNRAGIPVARFDLLTTADYVEDCVRREVLNESVADPLSEYPKPSEEVEAEAEAESV